MFCNDCYSFNSITISMAVKLTDNVWCYSESECKEIVADILRKQMTNESLFVRFVVDIAFRVVVSVCLSNLIIIFLPKNLYNSLMDMLRLGFCLFLVIIVWIALF
jgi:hypothetical protein